MFVLDSVLAVVEDFAKSGNYKRQSFLVFSLVKELHTSVVTEVDLDPLGSD